jgi:hypothetical protein
VDRHSTHVHHHDDDKSAPVLAAVRPSGRQAERPSLCHLTAGALEEQYGISAFEPIDGAQGSGK